MAKQRIRLTESQLNRVIKESVKRVLKEYKNKDTERFNTTGKKYDKHDKEMMDKHYSRPRNRFPDGAKDYLYHNKDVAKTLAVHGLGQQMPYDEYDYDEPSYSDMADEQWLHDHPISPSGYLWRRDAIPTFDGGIERGRRSDLY